jgi:AraC family transcriptional regulator
MEATHLRRVEPLAQSWRSFSWRTGVFDTAHRPFTQAVEGIIRMPYHLVMVTLSGGSEQLEARADGGHSYVGCDRPGAVSFVPAHCERRLRMKGVCAEWASIALFPQTLDELGWSETERQNGSLDLAPFTNITEPFLSSLVGELARLSVADGRLDAAYCEAMSHALLHYLVRRHAKRAAPAAGARAWDLPHWRMRRIAEYVEAHLTESILVADLASLVGVSAGHLHRAFRATLGVTPLDYIVQKRIQRAAAILAREQLPITQLALRVGISSPGHFARAFRRVTGASPSAYRRAHHDSSGA